MERGSKEWRKLAAAFFALAHNDFELFHRLEPHLQQTEVGQLCSQYIESGDHALVEQAGIRLTGSRAWYAYLGRSM